MNITINFFILELLYCEISPTLATLVFWTKSAQKGVFRLKTTKEKHNYCIPHISISYRNRFQVKLIILISFTNFFSKGYFSCHTKMVNSTIEFCTSELVKVTNFGLKQQFWCFAQNLSRKSETKKVNVTIEFRRLKLVRAQIWCYTDDFQFFNQKVYFSSKTETVNTTTKFCIFQLVKRINFKLNWQFWLFGSNFSKRDISCLKQKTWKNERYHFVERFLRYLRNRFSLSVKFQLKLRTLIFWNKFARRGYFQSKIEKRITTIEFCIFKLVKVTNASFWWPFACFLLNFPGDSIFSLKQR